MHVLDGALTVHVDNREWTLLSGDSITFAAIAPHFVRNNSKRTTRIELVITPPSF
jgi:quercetin dioxygenase-like cupin family protein